jgi:hypothetical protein
MISTDPAAQEARQMRFVMFTVVGEQGAAEWEAMSGEECRAFMQLHDAWFREHREQINGVERQADMCSRHDVRSAPRQ